MSQQFRQRIGRLMAWEPPRRPPLIAWFRLSDDDLEFLEQLAVRAQALPTGQTLIATLKEDERARLERISAKAGQGSTI